MGLRAVLIRLQTEFPSQETVMEASKRFGALVADASYTGLPSEYRTSVYTVMLRESGPRNGQKVFADLMVIFQRASTHPEKLQVMRALGYGASKELKDRALSFALSSEVKLQDIMYTVYSVSGSGPGGALLAWEWFQAHFEELKGKASASMGIMSHLVTACSGRFVTSDKADEVEAFFQAHLLPLCERKISQNLEAIRGSAAWLESMLKGKLSQDGFFEFLVGQYLEHVTRSRAESGANEMDELLG